MREVNTDQLEEIVERTGDVSVINVLSPDQFRRKHIPGSDNIPLSDPEFVQKVEDIAGGRDQPVIVYCASEECDASQKAADKLDEAGFSKVYDYTGGMEAWEEEGRSVQAGASS